MNQPVPITPATNHKAVTRFGGYSIYEDASAAALLIFRHGSATGQILGYQKFAADASATVFVGDEGVIDTPDGVYVVESAGSVTGVLYQHVED